MNARIISSSLPFSTSSGRVDPTAGNVQDADAFPVDELIEREIDELYVAEMQRRDAARARWPIGWRECPCAGCGCAMLARDTETCVILCSQCEAA